MRRRRKKEKKTLSPEELAVRYKKRYRRVLAVLVVIVVLTGLYVYLNYDYLAFKHFITSTYIYTDTLDAVFEKELAKDVEGRYFTNFDDMVISVVTRRIREEKGDKYTYLYTPEHLQRVRTEEKEEASESEIKELTDKTIYLRLTNFSKYTRKFMKDNMERLRGRENIIIDLRGNLGGDIDAMVAISSMFLPKKSVIATDEFRFWRRVYRSNQNQPLEYKKIVILQDEYSASSTENLIAALNDNLDNVELIGTRTFGKGIGQFTLPLKRGYAVKATILKWFTPRGINIHEKGIEPDIEYTAEDIVQYALERIE